MWQWTRLASAKWEEEWEERLRPLSGSSLAITALPGGRSVRLQVFASKKKLEEIQRHFGGRISRLRQEAWLRPVAMPPLRIRRALVVFGDTAQWKAAAPNPTPIFIPAGLAFGTGHHATTAGCLRLLADSARSLPSDWRMADLGCGSGILGIAGAKLGASAVEALDYDPECVRTAKANVERNRVDNMRVRRGDVLRWKPRARFEIITANLFSDVLIVAAPVIAHALKPGGTLVFSGVLRDQSDACLRAFAGAGLAELMARGRGKWIFGSARKVA